MTSLSDRDPFTVIAIAGRETSVDIKFALSLLARLGFGPEVVHDYEQLLKTEPDPERYPIDEVTSREQWLGKEHFLSFRDRYAGEFHGTVATRAFRLATHSGNYIGYPKPALLDRFHTPLGLKIPGVYMNNQPHMQTIDRRAIRVDTFLDQAKPMILGDHNHRPKHAGAKTQQFTSMMASWLEDRTNQLETAGA